MVGVIIIQGKNDFNVFIIILVSIGSFFSQMCSVVNFSKFLFDILNTINLCFTVSIPHNCSVVGEFYIAYINILFINIEY